MGQDSRNLDHNKNNNCHRCRTVNRTGRRRQAGDMPGSRKQSGIDTNQNLNKQRRDQREIPFARAIPHNNSEKTVPALNRPFREILHTGRNRL